MEKIEAAFSLRWKILAWFFINLLVVGGMLFLFLRVQFHVGINSLLAGATADRLEAIARPLATELHQRPSAEWGAALDREISKWRARGVSGALYRNDGVFLAGDLHALPAEVLGQLAQREHRPPDRAPGGYHPPEDGPGGPRGRYNGVPGDGPPPGPPDDKFDDFRPPPDDAFDPSAGHGNHAPDGARTWVESTHTPAMPMEKFMLATSGPRMYWAGISLGPGLHRGPGGGPSSVTLLLVSDSLRGGGLFFDYVPWLALGGGLLLVSVVMWLPFVHGLTRTLARMTHTAEEIAQGRFEPPHISWRRDELGRLNRALGHMAARLDGFVTGQKRFLGDTAHELLSPLARLEVALSILEHQAESERGKQYADKALEEVHHISMLVQDLLSFTKAGLQSQTAELQSVPLVELAQRAVAREAAHERVTVDIAENLQVSAEPDLLVRALSNGIRNAVRYAGEAGPIIIAAVPGREEDGAKIVALTVSDRGPGVPLEAMGRLFDPFFRPETARTRETGGVGLGLAIVKSCVEACGGRVAVRNREPTGFELMFILKRTG